MSGEDKSLGTLYMCNNRDCISHRKHQVGLKNYIYDKGNGATSSYRYTVPGDMYSATLTGDRDRLFIDIRNINGRAFSFAKQAVVMSLLSQDHFIASYTKMLKAVCKELYTYPRYKRLK
jgi:hypothetical protein